LDQVYEKFPFLALDVTNKTRMANSNEQLEKYTITFENQL